MSPWMSRLAVLSVLGLAPAANADAPPPLEIPADVLEDKIRGGLHGQLLGNLNGLPHEMKYIAEPGAVEQYTPGLPDGARTDDDTDIEWVYVTEMHRSGRLLLSPRVIADLWRRHINRSIWCSNDYARKLMDLGLEPPLTGRVALNPWAEFNISGSFLAETFALVSPAMPRTAARAALNYTHVAIDGEPAQTTQFVTAMIATAYADTDVERILDAGVAAVDPGSALRPIIADVQQWHAQHPGDWRATRRLIKDKYQRHNGEMRDRNGYELNTASTVAALLYGRGDFAETLRLAFNFGWDADNNAATCGSILGVMKGRKWMDAQGWKMKDIYRNTTRDAMPMDETITGFGDKLVALAKLAILEEGGREEVREGRKIYLVATQRPVNLEPLPKPLDRGAELREALRAMTESDLTRDDTARARAAYVAICIGDAERLARERPEEWKRAVDLLKQRKALLKAIRDAVPPTSRTIQLRARDAGL
jgi:hypothetical protein